MSKLFQSSNDAESFLQVFHTPGLGYTSCVKEYNKDKPPHKYQDSTVAVDYRGPRYCAEMLSGVFPGVSAKAHVLDVAAGTGLVGQELRKRGFCNIDAHDGADAMMEYCKKTGFYKNFYVSVVGDGHRLPIKDQTYDALTCCGAILENHLPISAQAEFIRVIKPGGSLTVISNESTERQIASLRTLSRSNRFSSSRRCSSYRSIEGGREQVQWPSIVSGTPQVKFDLDPKPFRVVMCAHGGRIVLPPCVCPIGLAFETN